MKVTLVEDQVILRDLICHYLKDVPEITDLKAVGDGESAYKMCLEEPPDVLVLDLMLASLNGIELLSRLRSARVNSHTLIFSAFYTTYIVRRVLELKAEGFIDKDAELPELRAAIIAVSRGELYFSPTILKIVRNVSITPRKGDEPDALTPREHEVLKLIAEGFTNRGIASMKNISLKTVETHRANIMRKLDLHDVANLTRYAIYHGIAPADYSRRKQK